MSGPTFVRLGSVLVERNDVVHPSDNPIGNSVFVGLEHIESNTGRRIGQLPVDLATLTGRKPRFRAGDLVYGYLRPYLNKLWLAEFDGLCSVDQYVFTVKTDVADSAFVAWFMRSPVFLSAASVVGISSQLPRIRRDEVTRMELPLPPLDEQKRIVARLSGAMDDVSRVRAIAKQQLDNLDAFPACLLADTFGRDRSGAARD